MAAVSTGGSAISLNRVAPVLDYTSLDFDALKADFITYAQANYSEQWTDFNPAQFAVILLENVVYVGDIITFYLNAGLREGKMFTAQRRSNIVTIARQLDYAPASASSATAGLSVVSTPGALPYPMPKQTTKFGAGPVIFQPDQDYTITATPQTIQVIEGEQFVDVLLGVSSGARSIVKDVPDSPVIDGTLVVSVNGIPWTEVESLTTASPGDTVYYTTVDDEDVTAVRFGDGVNGKIPPAGMSITASYRIGGGVQGRVGPLSITSLVNVPAGVISVSNPDRATGGDDGETSSEIKSAAPANLSAGDRCVTIPDYAIKARKATQSVGKAVAQQLDNRTVRVVIAPAGGGQPTDALKNTVATYLADRRMVGHRVRMDGPTYASVAIEADLFLVKTAITPAVVQAARSLFLTTNTNATPNGLCDFDNVGFGARSNDGTPQITRRSVSSLLERLRPRGVQEVRIRKLTTIPQLRAAGIVSSLDSTLAWSVARPEDLWRRRWRIKFTSTTQYAVYEGIAGKTTALTKDTLSDDRAQFPSLIGVAATLNPNVNQTQVFDLDETLCTATTLRIASATDSLYSVALTGDYYRLEWPANAVSGTVGVAYTPTSLNGEPHGFSWTVNGTGFSIGDEYTIDVFGYVDDLILADDEIPELVDANLVINAASAY